MIPAKVRCNNTGFETEFDASEWFDQATPDQVAVLARCDFQGNPAEDVARFCADGDDDVGYVLEQADAHPDKDVTCTIDKAFVSAYV